MWTHDTASSLRFPFLAACLAAALSAQQTPSWAALANPAPPFAAAWDPVHRCTALIAKDGYARHWEWDGDRLVERRQELEQVAEVLWVGSDPRHGLVAVARNPVRVGRWDGTRWSWAFALAAPDLGALTRFAFDEHRRRVIALHPGATSLEVHEWDGSQWWSLPAVPGPAPRLEASFAFDPTSDRCLLYGGEANGTALADCWSWDGSTWTQRSANAAPGPRTAAAMAFAPSVGRMLLYGGSSSTTTWQLTGSIWTAIGTAHDPGPCARGLLVRDRRGMLLVGTDDPHGVAWRFENGDWQATDATFVQPASTVFAGAAFDRARGQTMIVGGIDSGCAVHLFESRWRGTNPSVSPAPRNYPRLCWSSIEQQVLFFGGIDASNTSWNDTWSWTGTDWLQRAPTTSPSPRRLALMVEDPLGGVMLFGGRDANHVLLDDHWHWNGSDWTLRSPANRPPAMGDVAAALDPVRDRVVVVVPVLSSPYSAGETWEWDGTRWTFWGTPPVTTFVFIAELGFDPRRGRVVAASRNSHEWDGTSWTPLSIVNQQSLAGALLVTDHARGRLLAVRRPVAELSPAPATLERYEFGCAIGPAPVLSGIDVPSPGNPAFALEIGTETPGTLAFLAIGTPAPFLPLGGGCAAYVWNTIGIVTGVATPGAQRRWPAPIPNDPALRGAKFVAQGAVLDPTRSPIGLVTLTSGLRVTIGD